MIEKSLKLKKEKFSITDRFKAFNKKLKLENEMLGKQIKQSRKKNSKIKNLMWDIVFIIAIAYFILGIILLSLVFGGVI
jgi:Trk-type K+ transport system membrane component